VALRQAQRDPKRFLEVRPEYRSDALKPETDLRRDRTDEAGRPGTQLLNREIWGQRREGREGLRPQFGFVYRLHNGDATIAAPIPRHDRRLELPLKIVNSAQRQHDGLSKCDCFPVATTGPKPYIREHYPQCAAINLFRPPIRRFPAVTEASVALYSALFGSPQR
jgi:hypothetical protein